MLGELELIRLSITTAELYVVVFFLLNSLE